MVRFGRGKVRLGENWLGWKRNGKIGKGMA